MPGFEPMSVLEDLERPGEFADITDVVRLLEVAEFELFDEAPTRRYYRHPGSGVEVYIRLGTPIPPKQSQAIAEKIRLHWP